MLEPPDRWWLLSERCTLGLLDERCMFVLRAGRCVSGIVDRCTLGTVERCTLGVPVERCELGIVERCKFEVPDERSTARLLFGVVTGLRSTCRLVDSLRSVLTGVR
jgi:hypothetical protein